MFTSKKDQNRVPAEEDGRQDVAESGMGSESLFDVIDKVNHEDNQSHDKKAKYADKIFTFLMSSYGKPNWNEEDAGHFRFSTANAMRHFLRKYSSLYSDYRQNMSNRLDESMATSMPRASNFNYKNSAQKSRPLTPYNVDSVNGIRAKIETPYTPPNITLGKQYPTPYDQILTPDMNDIIGFQEPVMDQDLKRFLKGNEEIDILEEHKKTYSYRGNVQDEGLPVFDGSLHLAGDMLLVGDIHIPSTNWQFMERITQIAKRHLSRPRRIVIVGDILNGDKDSRYEHIIAPISRYKEFKITDALLQTWARVFDEIYLTPGNHLHRLIRRLEGDIGMNELARLLTSAHEKVSMSHYDEVHVRSGDENWVATHQINYAKSKLKIGNLLAQKFQSNIVTFHQHHSAMGRDDYNRYTIIDCGGMHRQDMMSYAMLVPNVMPNMNNGFVLLRDGTGHLLTPYPSITDWSMWV